MHYQAAAGVALVAGFSLMQSCPAPVAAFIPLIISVVSDGANGIINIVGKRDLGNNAFKLKARISPSLEAREIWMDVPSGVLENVVEDCCDSLNGATITATGENPEGGIKISGIPFPCISLTPWIDGTGIAPFSCGDDCLQWAPVAQDEYNQIRETLLNKFGGGKT